MTIDPKQLALDFAREVIGWPTAIVCEKHHPDTFFIAANSKYDYENDVFWQSNPVTVMKYVADWCDGNDKSLSMKYCERKWGAEVGRPGAPSYLAFNDDLRIALMEACLDAARAKVQERVVQS